MQSKWVAVLLAPLLAGCALPSIPTPPPAPEPIMAEVTAFSLSSACVERYQSFVVTLTLHNPEERVGRADVSVYAQQWGNLGRVTADLEPGETRTFELPATIDFAGRWDVYLTGAHAGADQARMSVVDPKAGQRC